MAIESNCYFSFDPAITSQDDISTPIALSIVISKKRMRLRNLVLFLNKKVPIRVLYIFTTNRHYLLQILSLLAFLHILYAQVVQQALHELRFISAQVSPGLVP